MTSASLTRSRIRKLQGRRMAFIGLAVIPHHRIHHRQRVRITFQKGEAMANLILGAEKNRCK